MKISSASKKVLASALSAAMVVAFAPTVAFATNQATTAATAKVTVATHDSVTGTPSTQETSFYGDATDSGLQKALDSVKNGYITVKATKGTGSAATTVNAVLVLNAANITNAAKGAVYELAENQAAISDGTLTVTSGATVLDSLSIDSVTVEMLADTADNVKYDGASDITIDLGGHTLANDADTDGTDGTDSVASASADTSAYVPLTLSPASSDAKVTVKNGTVKPTALNNTAYASDKTVPATVSPLAISETAGATTLDGVTAESGISLDTAEADTIKGGTFKAVSANATYKGTVKTGAIAGSVTLDKAADLAVSVEEAKGDAKGITGAVSLGKDSKLAVDVTAAGKDANAVGIDMSAADADLTVGAYDADNAANNSEPTVKVSVSASSKANDNNKYIKGIKLRSGKKLDVQNGTVEISAASVDDRAASIAIDGAASVSKGDVKVTATADDEEKATAVNGALTAATGTFTGKLGTLAKDSITGGSFTAYPQNADKNAVDLTKYEIADENGFYVVRQFNGYTIADFSNTSFPGAKTAVENYLNGKTDAAEVTLASGVTLADLQAQSKQAGDKKLQIIATKGNYSAKKATAEQKAAYDAISAYAKANKFIAPAEANANFQVQSLVLGYYADNAAVVNQTPTVLGTVDTLGGVTTGRTFTANEELLFNSNGTATPTTTVVAYDGKTVTPLAWVADKPDSNKVKVKSNKVYAAFAQLTIDPNAIKDAIIKGDEPAAEKATQGIDVAKKSKTVKLAKKATKTKKAQSFSMGISAETAVTTAKKSGSKYVTVKGGKVTLKKGVKKGTYTAKVTIKAAASDQYLAAAKTVTVKFTVKK